jgi:hypothetical protein
MGKAPEFRPIDWMHICAQITHAGQEGDENGVEIIAEHRNQGKRILVEAPTRNMFNLLAVPQCRLGLKLGRDCLEDELITVEARANPQALAPTLTAASAR